METTQKLLNGVNLDNLFGTIDVVKKDPQIAQFQFRARNQWIDGSHNRTTIKDFYGGCQEDTSRTAPFVFDNDEPPILLGVNKGANPVEFILHGLAGCLTTSMVLHAAALGIPVERVESTLEGDLDVQGLLGLNDDVRNGYQGIRVRFRIEGPITEEQKQRLVQIAQQRSPVFDIVSNPVPVTVELQ